jgi:hypothetical protein
MRETVEEPGEEVTICMVEDGSVGEQFELRIMHRIHSIIQSFNQLRAAGPIAVLKGSAVASSREG